MLHDEHIRRILVVKLRAIGDVLLSTPVVENLRLHFPDARIDFLTERFAADVLRGNPWINDIVVFDSRKDSGWSLVRKVRQGRYDAVIDLFGNPRTAILTRLSGARHRIGFPFRGRSYAYNVKVPPRGGVVHNVDFNLDALRFLQIPAERKDPHFPIPTDATEFADRWLAAEHLAGREVVALNPSGGWGTKRWGLEHYAALGDAIEERHGSAVVLLWGPGEDEDARRIRSMMKRRAVMIPETTLHQLGAIVRRCSFVVSNDSGPMHIAAALGVPTLGIFGPTNPRFQGPYGDKHLWVRNEKVDCLGCNLTECRIGTICMTHLNVETVFRAFQQLVERHRSSEPTRT